MRTGTIPGLLIIFLSPIIMYGAYTFPISVCKISKRELHFYTSFDLFRAISFVPGTYLSHSGLVTVAFESVLTLGGTVTEGAI